MKSLKLFQAYQIYWSSNTFGSSQAYTITSTVWCWVCLSEQTLHPGRLRRDVKKSNESIRVQPTEDRSVYLFLEAKSTVSDLRSVLHTVYKRMQLHKALHPPWKPHVQPKCYELFIWWRNKKSHLLAPEKPHLTSPQQPKWLMRFASESIVFLSRNNTFISWSEQGIEVLPSRAGKTLWSSRTCSRSRPIPELWTKPATQTWRALINVEMKPR